MTPTWTGDGVELWHGDCLAILPELPEACANAVIADPPYGTTACKWDSVIPLAPMWAGLKHVAKERAAIVMTASQPFTTTLIASNMKMFKYCWVWEKEQGTGFARANTQPLRKHEDIIIFYRKQPHYDSTGYRLDKVSVVKRKPGSNSSSDSDSLANADDRVSVYTHASKHTILLFARDKGHHPTQKPVALMSYLIRTYTNEGETVLDFTMGSGTTGVAAIREGRKFVGIEKDETYFNIARDRIERELREQRIQPRLF